MTENIEYRLVRESDKAQILKTKNYWVAMKGFENYKKNNPYDSITFFVDRIIVESEVLFYYSPLVGKPVNQISKFYRHIRFKDSILGDIDHNSGITFYVWIDHNEKKLSFSYALCQNLPFQKKVGREISRSRYPVASLFHDGTSVKNQILNFIMSSESREFKILKKFIERKQWEGLEIV